MGGRQACLAMMRRAGRGGGRQAVRGMLRAVACSLPTPPLLPLPALPPPCLPLPAVLSALHLLQALFLPVGILWTEAWRAGTFGRGRKAFEARKMGVPLGFAPTVYSALTACHAFLVSGRTLTYLPLLS